MYECVYCTHALVWLTFKLWVSETIDSEFSEVSREAAGWSVIKWVFLSVWISTK